MSDEMSSWSANPSATSRRDVVGAPVVGLVLGEPDVVDLEPGAGLEHRQLDVQPATVAHGGR